MFSQCTTATISNETDHLDRTEILLKVALCTHDPNNFLVVLRTLKKTMKNYFLFAVLHLKH